MHPPEFSADGAGLRRAAKKILINGEPKVRKVRCDKGGTHDKKHKELVAGAAALCAERDYLFFASKTIKFGKQRFGSAFPKGFPDALIFKADYRNKFMAVEFKILPDQPKDEQAAWLARLRKEGFRCACSRLVSRQG